MIDGFRHNGLKALYERGRTAGMPADQVKRLRRILAVLDSIGGPAELRGLPGLRLHPLKGHYRGYWSLTVSGNWRVIFRFDGENVEDVDLVDYH